MKILAFGWWKNSGNIGDEAIYLGVRELFKEHEIISLPSFIFRKPFKTLKEYATIFDNADLVMMTGGTPIYDYDHLLRTFHMLLPKLLNKPFVLFGIGVKPLHSYVGRSLVRKLVDMADKISVRDPISARILKAIGIRKECKVTGDSAMVLKSQSFKFDKKGFVAICPRRLSIDYKKHYHQQLSNDQIRTIRKKFKRMIEEEWGEKIVLPFHTDHYDDDLKEAEMLGLTNYHKLLIKDPRQMLYLISKSRKVIGMRLHSLIFAFISGVDFETILYDIKIKGFLQLIETSTKNEIIKQIRDEAKSVVDLVKN